jgi:hypothetical protein
MKSEASLQVDLEVFGRRMLIVGAVGAGLCALGWLFNAPQVYRSWLFAFVFWLNIPLGLMGLLMLQHLVGGAWGAVLRGVLEAGTRTIPYMAALFLPICFGIPSLYVWTQWNAETLAHEPTLAHKMQYLNIEWFLIRAVLYFAIWSIFAMALVRWSQVQQHGGNPRITRRLAKLSGAGLLFGGLAVSFASFDWVMSLEPHWYSTIYGLLYVTSEFLTGMALAIVVTEFLARYEPLGGVVRPNHYQDLGSLLFAFVIFWAYMAFSQYLIIWSGDILEEIRWYEKRLHGGWGWLAIALVLFHFLLPLFALLSRHVKRDAQRLARVALVILIAHVLNVYWLVKPAFAPYGSGLHWLDLAALAAIGGLWLAIFAWQLRRQPTVLVFERSS